MKREDSFQIGPDSAGGCFLLAPICWWKGHRYVWVPPGENVYRCRRCGALTP